MKDFSRLDKLLDEFVKKGTKPTVSISFISSSMDPILKLSEYVIKSPS